MDRAGLWLILVWNVRKKLIKIINFNIFTYFYKIVYSWIGYESKTSIQSGYFLLYYNIFDKYKLVTDPNYFRWDIIRVIIRTHP